MFARSGMRGCRVVAFPCLVSLFLSVTLTSFADPAGEDRSYLACGAPPSVVEGKVDFRMKGVSVEAGRSVAMFDRFHTSLAIDEMSSGSFSRNVKANLDFTLRHCPYHLQALQALIKYDSAGGKMWDFPDTECFLYWARQFAPDDGQVILLDGNYSWRRGRLAHAQRSYEQALELMPDSAEAHYVFGLFLFDLAEFSQALEQAWAAYALGYPLPGLRDKLQRAGVWRDPPLEAGSGGEDSLNKN